MRGLLLRLEGPMQSYGGEAVDARRPVRDMPGASMIVGLLANALGLRRYETEAHERLQERMSFAARLDRRGERLREFQTAQLAKDDVIWTTTGVRADRAGDPDTYASPLVRQLEYDADKVCVVALTLASDDAAPSLDAVAAALRKPARPLCLGRRSYVPSAPILLGERQGADLLSILLAEPLIAAPDASRIAVQYEGIPGEGDRIVEVADTRNWKTRLFGGTRRVVHGFVAVNRFPKEAAA